MNGLLRGIVGVVVLLGSTTAFAEGPPNWLSDVVKKARADYRIEARQHNHIKTAIQQKKPEGVELAKSPKLDHAITEGLKAADKRQKEIDADPKLATASPAVQASWTIFEVAGVPVPTPKD